MRRIDFVPGEYYHIFNHGIEERVVFSDESDFTRALVSMVTFNDQENSPPNLSRFVQNPDRLIQIYTPDERDRLVDIICFTLLPTHYHLFVKEKSPEGISRFMHRFGKGYARYFNLKNERRGSLWEGPFKVKHIDKEPYFHHIVSYIHLNILDLYEPSWREGKIEDWKAISDKLASYPWSSYGYYREDDTQLPYMDLILTQPQWLSKEYPNSKDFEKRLKSWSSRGLRNTSLSLEEV